MGQKIQLPPIPASVLGIADIIVEKIEITENNEFIITVKSTEQKIFCKKCGRLTVPHGHNPTIELRYQFLIETRLYTNNARQRPM